MIDMNTTANRIAAARKEKGFTQEELSVRLGVSAQAVSKWERALGLPDIDLLIDLSDILGVPTDFLLGRADLPARNKTLYDIASSNPLSDYTLTHTMIDMQFGSGLIPFITECFLKRVAALRSAVLKESGVLLPAIRIRDVEELGDNQVHIYLLGRLRNDMHFDIGDPDNAAQSTEIQDRLMDTLKSSIQEDLAGLINRHMVKLLVEQLRTELPFCIEGVIPERISLTRLKVILKDMVRSGRSINNLFEIIETIDEQIE